MKFNLFQHFFLPLYCATLFAVHQHQALDIATIPVNKIKDVTTINKSDPVDLDNTVPRFTYRVVVNDHFHLQCTPLSDPLKYDVHEEVWTAKKKKTKGKLNTTAPLDEIETADGYFRLHNFDVAFFGNQLALLQARSTWWVEAGENLTSLVAAFREKKLKEAGVLMAGLFEADNVTPQYLCRSLKNPTELGLQSLSDGLCRTVEPLPEGGVKNPKDWSIRGSTLTNYQLLTSLQKDDIFNWTELNAVEVLHGGWTPPPNAVEVDIGKTDVSSSYHSPLYIARYKVNSSLTVVMALPRGAQLVLDNAAAGVELLVVSEVSYQVKVRFSGLGVHLLNSLAEKWDETLNCKLDAKTDGSAGDSSSCSCGPEVEKKTNEIQLVDLKMENLKRNAVLGKSKLNSKQKKETTSWKVFRKSVRKSPYWGKGWGGSLMADGPVFVKIQNPSKSSNKLQTEQNRRYLCRANVEGQGFLQNYRPGFLDISKSDPECNLFYVGTEKPNLYTKAPYHVLYSSSPEVTARFRWTPYSQSNADKLGAITAGYYLFSKYESKRMFWARLEQNNNLTKDSAKQTLYGTIVTGEDVFRYFIENVNETQEMEMKEAVKTGVQVLTLS